MKFRLKHIEGTGWFAQVNPEGSLYIKGSFLDNWYTINEQDFYPETDISFPEPNKTEALALIEEFKKSSEPKYPKVEYYEV